MKIDNRFTASAPIDRAWAVLTDLASVAPCLPGAQLTGVDGDAYTGKVKIKIGPVVSEYGGTARFLEKHEEDHRAVINAAGRDSRGAGNAAAVITAQLHPDGEHTEVVMATDLKITGKVAQFGSNVIKEVSEKMLGQFVSCLEGRLAAEEAPAPAAPAAETTTAAAPGAVPTPAPTPGPAAARTNGATATAAPAAPSTAPSTAAPAAASAPQQPEQEVEPLDLMKVAGPALSKRLVPVGVVLLVIVALIIYFVVRR